MSEVDQAIDPATLQQLFLMHFEKSGGNVTAACNQADITTKEFNEWFLKDASFRDDFHSSESWLQGNVVSGTVAAHMSGKTHDVNMLSKAVGTGALRVLRTTQSVITFDFDKVYKKFQALIDYISRYAPVATYLDVLPNREDALDFCAALTAVEVYQVSKATERTPRTIWEGHVIDIVAIQQLLTWDAVKISVVFELCKKYLFIFPNGELHPYIAEYLRVGR